MRVRAIDANHDFTFGTGYNNYAVNQNAVIEVINTRLNSFLGDCFFDLSAGIDWFNLLGGKDQISLNLAITAVILNTQNVVALAQLTANLVRTTRAFSVSYQVQSVYSTQPIPGGTSINLTTVS